MIVCLAVITMWNCIFVREGLGTGMSILNSCLHVNYVSPSHCFEQVSKVYVFFKVEYKVAYKLSILVGSLLPSKTASYCCCGIKIKRKTKQPTNKSW